MIRIVLCYKSSLTQDSICDLSSVLLCNPFTEIIFCTTQDLCVQFINMQQSLQGIRKYVFLKKKTISFL
jgi:hypothetical protein